MPRLKRADYSGFVPALEFDKVSRMRPPLRPREPDDMPLEIRDAGTGPSRRTGGASRQAGDGGDLGRWELLGPLWCLVAQYGSVALCGAVLQVNTWVCQGFREEETIWRFHSTVMGLVRPARRHSCWRPLAAPPLQVAGIINWRRLLQLNLTAWRKPWVWVRVDGTFVRVPLPVGSTLRLEALTNVVTTVVSAVRAKDPLLPWRPLRLRWLQWGGRPGNLVRDGSLLAGASILAEWALPRRRGWPLPPEKTADPCSGLMLSPWAQHQPNAQAPRFGTSRRGRAAASPVEQLLRSSGVVGGFLSTDTSTRPSYERDRDQVLLCIESLLTPSEMWLTIDRDSTVDEFFKDVTRMFRRQSPLLSDMGRPLQFKLMDWQHEGYSQASEDDVLVPEQAALGTRTLRQLFWAQSETIRVELDSTWSPEGGARGFSRARAANGPVVRLLVWRQAAFESSAAASPGQAAPSWALAPESGLTGPHAWPPRSPGEAMLTRATEGELDLPEMGTQVAGEHSTTLREGRWRCSSPSSTGHPGDMAVDFPEPVSGDEREAVGTSGLCWERVVPHYRPQLLPATAKTRQFEFHPSMSNLIMIGDKKGGVNVLDLESPELHPQLVVGLCPLLGLAWLRHHPQIAACGTSHSGKITFMKYEPTVSKTEPTLSFLQTLEEFPKLSSLSANCTDDFMLVSGISPNLAVYDVQTGKVMTKASGVHEHFINISRFCNTSPHVFATSSFDHTCKVWDLRRPMAHDRAVKTLVTGGQNVMCTFSPDDKHILCSGVDTRISQFEAPSWRQSPERFPLREPFHRERYRRSSYTASGQHFATAATEESHMHLMSVAGRKLGVIDFRGVIKEWAPPLRTPHPPSLKRMPQSSALVKGAVQLDDADPNGGSSRNNHEFVQSIRAHPELNNRFGVLLSLTTGEQSYVAMVDVDRRVLTS